MVGKPAKGPDIPLPGSVLFVCGMNSIRSPMAEKLMRARYGSDVYVQSAGARAGEADGFMQTVMNERGIDMTDHTPVSLDDLEESYFDLIITLSPEAHHRALEFTRAEAVDVEYWPTMDPSTVAGSREHILQAYRQTADAIDNRILSRFG
ncbi:MAG: low molecular weight phosphatase family protein [Rhizobiaceae bacterium]